MDTVRHASRSFVVIDSVLYNSSEDHTTGLDHRTTGHKLDSHAHTNALTLESTVVWERGSQHSRVLRAKLHQHHEAELVARSILTDLVTEVVDQTETKRREKIVAGYLARHVPQPIVQHEEIQQMNATMSTTLGSLSASTNRLTAAWRIILVSTAQQLCQSYREILLRKNCELQIELQLYGHQPRSLLTDTEGLLVHLLKKREAALSLSSSVAPRQSLPVTTQTKALADVSFNYVVAPLASPERDLDWEDNTDIDMHSRATSVTPELVGSLVISGETESIEKSESEVMRRLTYETLEELSGVTDRILDLAVIYLKNATRDVVDLAVDNVKTIMTQQSV